VHFNGTADDSLSELILFFAHGISGRGIAAFSLQNVDFPEIFQKIVPAGQKSSAQTPNRDLPQRHGERRAQASLFGFGSLSKRPVGGWTSFNGQ
jgi:hypothetical protein